MYTSRNHLMPGTVRTARTLMSIQLLMTILVNVLLFLPLAITGILLPNLFFGIGMSVLVGLLIVKMRTRSRWVRWASGVIQIVLVATSIAGLVGGPSAGAFAGLALAAAVFALLLTPSCAAWFDA
ncbi:hypothetical protein [Nonomuraea typhae]|uniref:Uncharacterized protein n=1 Tax=Nonomuraea typhae TaxID=2603600 RepID=A0ABW7Z8E6_9ACTN